MDSPRFKLVSMSYKRGEWDEIIWGYHRYVLKGMSSVFSSLFNLHGATLTKLTLELDRFYQFPKFNKSLNKPLPNVKELHLIIREIEYFDAREPVLNAEVQDIWRPFMLNLAKQLPALEALRIEAFPKLKGDSLLRYNDLDKSYIFDWLAKDAPDVFHWNADVTCESGRIACFRGTRFPNLKSLSMTGSVKRDGGWQPLKLWLLDGGWFFRNCPNLEHLELRAPFGIEESHMDNGSGLVSAMIRALESPKLAFARLWIYGQVFRSNRGTEFYQAQRDENYKEQRRQQLMVKILQLVEGFGGLKRDQEVSTPLEVIVDVRDGLDVSRMRNVLGQRVAEAWLLVPEQDRKGKMLRILDNGSTLASVGSIRR